MNLWNEIHSEVKRPPDFDAFWLRVLDEVAELPLEWDRVPDPVLNTGNANVEVIRFSSINGITVYGWYAVPHGASVDNIGYLWLPGYSLGNPPPKLESLYPGTVTFGLNVHGNLPDKPYVHPSSLGKDYVTQGIDSPETYIFRDIVAHCVRAIAILAAQPEVDPNKVVVGGMSQGGGLALMTAALEKRVRLCFADMPWLCDIDRALSLIDRERYARLPKLTVPDRRYNVLKYAEEHPDRYDQIFQTYRYFDPLSHAGNIHCPTQMSAGGRDPSCKPPTIFAVYNEISAPKEMLYLPNTGHEIVSEMHQSHSKWLLSELQ